MSAATVRRRALFPLLLACALAPAGTWAQTYPTLPIRLIVPFTPAGATDVVARMVASRVSETTGWNFVVDNRPGASGNIGMEAVAKAKPDGYTLAMGQTANLAINPALFSRMPFDPLKDFAPIALVASLPVVLVVRADAPYKKLADLVTAGKAQPGKLTQALAANGTVGHLAGELLSRKAGMKVTNVPYKGAGPAITDLMGGQTDFMFATPQAVVQLIKAGKVRALAVSSAKRITVLPDVPTIAESGYPGFEAVDWKALVAPKGTSPEIVKALNAAIDKALGQPATIAQLLADGSAPMGGTPEQAAAMIKAEHARWGALVKDAGIKLD